MSETIISIDPTPAVSLSVDVNTIKTVLGYLKKGLSAAEFIAHMTGKAATEAEIKVIEAGIAKYEPYLSDPSVAAVIDMLLGLFQKDGVKAVEEKLKAILG
jgi:hypothetical protein